MTYPQFYIVLIPGGRKRRSAANAVDYSDCSVRVTKHNTLETKLELQIMFVCTTPPEQRYVCDTMLKRNMVTSCTDENGVQEQKPTTTPPPMNPERFVYYFR